RDAHLHATPPDLSGVTPAFQTGVRMMLRKTPEARPSRDRVRAVLHGAATAAARMPASDAVARLAAAADAHERAQAHAAAAEAKRRTAAANREAILGDARAALR